MDSHTVTLPEISSAGAAAETDSTRSSIKNFKEMVKQNRYLKAIEEFYYRFIVPLFDFKRKVAAVAETDSTSRSSTNFKEIIEQNADLKAIAEYFYNTLIPSFKSKVAVVVPKIDFLLSTAASLRLVILSKYDLVELDFETVAVGHDNDWPNLISDDLDPRPVDQETMGRLIRLQKDRISNLLRSIERRRRVYNATIMTAVISILAGSAWLQVTGEKPAAVAFNALALVIKAAETCVNLLLSEEERMLKEDEEVVKMMRDGELLMVSEFKNVQQQAKELNEEIIAEHSKLTEHIQRMERLEMVKTIMKMECRLKALKRIIRGYGNGVQQFLLKFSTMVIN